MKTKEALSKQIYQLRCKKKVQPFQKFKVSQLTSSLIIYRRLSIYKETSTNAIIIYFHCV